MHIVYACPFANLFAIFLASQSERMGGFFRSVPDPTVLECRIEISLERGICDRNLSILTYQIVFGYRSAIGVGKFLSKILVIILGTDELNTGYCYEQLSGSDRSVRVHLGVLVYENLVIVTHLHSFLTRFRDRMESTVKVLILIHNIVALFSSIFYQISHFL